MHPRRLPAYTYNTTNCIGRWENSGEHAVKFLYRVGDPMGDYQRQHQQASFGRVGRPVDLYCTFVRRTSDWPGGVGSRLFENVVDHWSVFDTPAV